MVIKQIISKLEVFLICIALMFIFEYIFLFSFSLVSSKRYYAFVETLFVIDTNYFPLPSLISYEEYVRTMVDTTNIVEFSFEVTFEARRW